MGKCIQTTPSEAWREVEVQSTSEPANLSWTQASDQTWNGFGGCFNEMGWEAMSVLKPEQRQALLKEFFGEGDSCRFNTCRLPIGANDYATSWYSLNEHEGDHEMQHFNIERDQRVLIPYIKEAMAMEPNLELFASPWSPPTWMKKPQAYNYGRLIQTDENLKAYALYFKKFVEAYAQEGLHISQVHVQNEPNSDQKFPSCVWRGAEMRDFIKKHLGPLFETSGLDCGIGLGTIERDDFKEWALTAMADPDCRKYIDAIGYQWAGKGSVQRTHQAFPETMIIQTENECCGGLNSWENAEYVFSLFQHYINNGVNAYVYWNMVLAPGGESTWGWHQNAMVTVAPESGSITFNPEFYVMKHFSRYIQRGAVRHLLTGAWSANGVAFKNPDGSKVMVVNNPLDSEQVLVVDGAGESESLLMPAHSFSTLVWP